MTDKYDELLDEYDSTPDKVKLLMDRFELDHKTAAAVVAYLDDADRAMQFKSLTQVLADYGYETSNGNVFYYPKELATFDDFKKYADADGRFADGFTKKGSDE